jgi:hypothetical protein
LEIRLAFAGAHPAKRNLVFLRFRLTIARKNLSLSGGHPVYYALTGLANSRSA